MATINLGRVAYVNRGAYNPATTYEKYDVVLYNNGSYVYIGDAASSGNTPTDTGYWQAMLDPTAMNEAAAIAKTAAEPIIFNKAGEIIAVDNAANRIPRVLNLYGRITQVSVPSPDTPVEMINAGSDGTAQLLIAGKNLFKPFLNNTTLNGITFSAGEDGSFTLNGTATKGFYVEQTPDVPIPPGTYTLTANRNVEATFSLYGRTSGGTTLGSTNSCATFTTTNAIVSFRLWINNGATFTNLVLRPQLELGSVATDYEPYRAQILAKAVPDGLPGIPVASGGNHVDASGQRWVADFIDIPGKCLNTLVGSFTLDGSEGYEWSIDSTSGISIAYVGPQDKWGAHDATLVNDTRLMSTHFVGGLLTDVGQIKMDSNFLNMSVPSSITTSAGMNAWLAANPVTVLYVRGEYVYTAIELDNVVLPSPNATVYNDSGCSIHLAYIADTKTYIDQKFAALAAAIVNN